MGISSNAAVRFGLVGLGLSLGIVAVFALVAPESFYADFPLGRGWVADLGPLNDHLVTDDGAAALGLATALVLAALIGERRLGQVALLALLVWSIPHLVFHLAYSDVPSGLDRVANLGVLVASVIVPILLLVLTRHLRQGSVPVGRSDQ